MLFAVVLALAFVSATCKGGSTDPSCTTCAPPTGPVNKLISGVVDPGPTAEISSDATGYSGGFTYTMLDSGNRAFLDFVDKDTRAILYTRDIPGSGFAIAGGTVASQTVYQKLKGHKIDLEFVLRAQDSSQQYTVRTWSSLMVIQGQETHYAWDVH